VVSPELARHLTETSRRLGRQVGVLVGRDGVIRHVIVGNAHQLDLPDVGRLRGGVGPCSASSFFSRARFQMNTAARIIAPPTRKYGR